MTGQAVVRDFVLLVAISAIRHSHIQKWHGNGHRLLIHVAVASGTLQFTDRHMTTMGKIHMIRNTVNLLPRDFSPFSDVLENLEFLW